MSCRRTRTGFTLLEVLAAAVIMAAMYGALSASNINATIAEGDANRRLHASLLADRVLAEIDSQRALGVPAPLGVREENEGDFDVRIEISALELPFEEWLPEPEDARPRDTRAPSLLSPAGRGKEPALRQIAIAVRWFDGVADREVRRTTFVLDSAAATELLQQAGVTLGSDGPGPEAPPGAQDTPEP